MKIKLIKWNYLILKIYELLTLPIALVGVLWYIVVQTPFFNGRMHAFDKLQEMTVRAYQETSEEIADEE